MQEKSYYEILNVSKDVTLEQIKKQYKKLAMRYYPGHGVPNDIIDNWKEIDEAYSILCDKYTRIMYDKVGKEEVKKYLQEKNKNFSDFEKVFKSWL
jgi:molecular chaperone DnaJ